MAATSRSAGYQLCFNACQWARGVGAIDRFTHHSPLSLSILATIDAWFLGPDLCSPADVAARSSQPVAIHVVSSIHAGCAAHFTLASSRKLQSFTIHCPNLSFVLGLIFKSFAIL